jgi:hypothetical protein
LENLNHILQKIDPISLKEMDTVKLLNRADTKFIFNSNILCDILEEIRPNYRVLSTEYGRINSYRTLYYDTKDLSSYITHHNGKLNRLKIRFREYIDSNLTFLEVKFKSNKGKTNKSRLESPAIENSLGSVSKDFINKNSFYNADDLVPTLWNSFSRLTLVHRVDKERLTIDLNIGFSKIEGGEKVEIPHLIIAEVKQEKATANSDFIRVMKRRHIRQSSMSKYCIGTVLTNKNVKSNKFKEHILKINKLENDRTVIA